MLHPKQWFLFMFGVFVLIILGTATLNYFVIIKPVYKTEIFKIPDNLTTLVIGASHSATAIDSQLLENTVNIARSGEPLFYTHYKAKMMLENNEHIEHLVLSISPIHIARYSEQSVFNGNSSSRQFAMEYYFLIDDLNDPIIKRFSSDNIIAYLKFHWGFPFNYMSDLKVSYNHYFKTVEFQAFPFFGGVESFEGNHISEQRQKKKANFYYYNGTNELKLSQIGIQSIKRLYSLSKEYNVTMTVISTPQHPFFKSLTPVSIESEFYALIKELSLEYKNTQYYDFTNFELADIEYLDGDHLNKYGAKKFTMYLKKQGISKPISL